MTKLQALFVLYLYHEDFKGYNSGKMAAHYYNRYNEDGTVKEMKDRIKDEDITSNQEKSKKGLQLVSEAFCILIPDEFTDYYGLDDCPLHTIKSNLSNHLKNNFMLYLKKEIREVRNIMKGRASVCNIPISEDLFELDKNPFDDWLDRENHEFDMGKYHTLKSTLKEYYKIPE